MILVVGATGVLGSAVCRLLRARGQAVRALVRAESPKTQALRDQGVDIVIGDLRVESSLEQACRGVTAVVSTATAMGTKDKTLTLREVDRDGQLHLVAAAAAAGVSRFVYVSVSPKLRERAPLVRYKREVERALRATGMQWTILQPSVFMEIWLGPALGWNIAAGRAMVFGSGAGPLTWISVHDVAAYAVRALEDPRLVDRELPLAGPQAMSPNEVIAMLERKTGRRFRVRHIPRPVLLALGPIVAAFADTAGSGMVMGAQAAEGDVFDNALQRELALPITTVEEYADRVLARS